MQDQVCAFSLIFTVILLSRFKGTSGLSIYQSPSVTGREGGTVILNCTLSNETLGHVRWYKGENQQQLLYSQLTTHKSDPRVTTTVMEGPTRETDQSITFTDITWDDAGMYYCVKFKSNKVTVAASGNGTQLYVTRKPSPPSVSGPNQQVWLNSYVTLSCLSAGFYPKEISITWWQNEMEFQNETITVSSYNGNKTYEVQSNIIVQAKIDSSVTCRINHTALPRPVTSTFQITNIVNDPSSPSISGPRERVLLNTNMALTCTSEGFYPKDVSVIWWQNGAEIKESMQTVSLYGANKTYKVQSSITVPGKIDSTVTCRINHIALQQPKESIFNMNDLLKGMPSLPSISGPTAQIVLNTYVILSCASEGFYPQDINVTWLQHDRELQGSTSDIHLYGQEKTYRVLSHIIVPARIDSPVTCRINHIALDQPVHSTFEMNSIVKGAPSHPSVSGPRDRILINTNVTLTCTSSGFYPSNISVTWWKNGTELPNPKKAIHLYGEDKTYRAQSNITVLAEIDSTVTCKINHTALDKPLHSAFNINDIVKGLPSSPSISGPTKQIMLNENVALSCTSDGFYPKEINITWLQNGKEVLNSTNIVYLNTANKTYHVQSNITVPAKTDSPVICRITHTALELPITSTFQMNNIVKDPSGQGLPVKIAGAACGFLVFILLTVMFLIHRKSKQGKNNTTSGSIPANCEAENKQDENNDIITYAALQLRNGSSVPKKVAQEKATEYAEVRFKKRVQDNNIVYADINITKLHTKETIPHYYIEDRGAEYATVKKNTKPSKK